MTPALSRRLDQILPRITDNIFLSSEGIGNEIACYIFDYPSDSELEVREHIEVILKNLSSHQSKLSVLHLNLLDVSTRYLEKRGLLDKALKMQLTKNDAAVLKALEKPLAAERISGFIADEHKPDEYDLFILSGVGSVWPMLRAHSLLNCLHKVIGHTPLVMFYPGKFDGMTLNLFGRVTTTISKPGSKPYYRAFSLVPEEKE